MIFAVIENNIVINTIVAENINIAQSLITENQEVENITNTLVGISWERYDGVLKPKKPKYECFWHEESNMWLTNEEINNYNFIHKKNIEL